MFKKDNFFTGNFINTGTYYKNIKKTKKIYNSFLEDLKNFNIPLLEPYKKNYSFDFSTTTIKKFSKYKNIIIIGMGGSILGVKSIYSFFQKKIKKNLFFFDNLDPNLNLKFQKIKNLKNSCFIVISKSGDTLETITNLGLVFSKNLLRNKLIIISEIRDSALMAAANEYDAEIIEHKEFASGRYSVLSESGMFPVSLMGLDLIKFKNLEKLIKDRNFISTLIQNVAAIYTFNSKKINNSVILNYDSSLSDLGYWYQQLVAESLGKKGKGINPMVSFCPKDHHSLLQLYLDGPKDKFFTFIQSTKKENNFEISKDFITNNLGFLKNKDLKFIINEQCQAVKKIFKIKKIPFRLITFTKKNENELGKIFTFFVLETILLSRLMNINPFDQPAVEQVKVETKKFLKQ